MEELQNDKRIREASTFTNKHKSSYDQSGRTRSLHFRDQKHFTIAKTRALGAHTEEAFQSPNHAMEFLCRSWTPSASNFLDFFSSSNPLLPLSDGDRIEDREEHLQETLNHPAERNKGLTVNNNDSNVITNPSLPLFHTQGQMNSNHEKGWLKGKLLTGFFRSHKEKKRDEVRFHTAKLHAALSLTQLAAAIAGFATAASTEAQNINSKRNGELTAGYEGMGGAVATAAALMTTVCAEAAESLGAGRAQVASAVNSGLAISNPIDMIAVTATTSTCLRGAAILKSRTSVDSFHRIQRMLKTCTHICIITPSGRKEYQSATIHSKHKHITICFKKKYFGGTVSTSKDYKLICIEEAMEGQGYFFLSLKTNIGIIKLLFEDQNQLNLWISTISNLLTIHNSSSLSAKKLESF